MKYLIIIIIGVVGWLGFVTHKDTELSIQHSILEKITEDGYDVDISGINLPLTFTFLSTKVDSEVFVQKGKRVGSFVVNVTPIGGYPILSIFDTVTYQISFPNTEMMKLSSFK